jgi:AraC-like DNA-binding protein
MDRDGTPGRYRELAPPPELREHLLCGWTLEVGALSTDAVLPDGCMDIVWRAGRGLIAAGPDTGPNPASRRPGSTVVGVRFRPGAGPAMLGVPAEELRDLRVSLTELWGDGAERLEDRLDGAGSARARLELLRRELHRRLARAERPDPLVAAAVMRLYSNDPGRVGALGDALGIGERQLRRRFHAAVGYGPKTLARVLRFQRLLALCARRGWARGELARLALDAGYADQAHMTAEVTRLAGRPPTRLLATRPAVTAGT